MTIGMEACTALKLDGDFQAIRSWVYTLCEHEQYKKCEKKERCLRWAEDVENPCVKFEDCKSHIVRID